MDVTGLSDPELIALLKIMRLGVRCGKWYHGALREYQITFVAANGVVLNASYPCRTLRACFNSLTPFGDKEIAHYGQHPTRQPEIDYP